LCPGPTRTGFQEQAGVASSWLFSFNVSKADKVAQTGYKALMKGRAVVIPGAFNKLQIQSARFATKGFLRAYVMWLNKNRKKQI
jgi:short-subunit dehydrogenase